MGRYIDKINGYPAPAKGKVNFIEKHIAGVKNLGSETPERFCQNLVCVMDNGAFEAAGYAFNEREFQAFARPDGRHKTWLIVPFAEQISN